MPQSGETYMSRCAVVLPATLMEAFLIPADSNSWIATGTLAVFRQRSYSIPAVGTGAGIPKRGWIQASLRTDLLLKWVRRTFTRLHHFLIFNRIKSPVFLKRIQTLRFPDWKQFSVRIVDRTHWDCEIYNPAPSSTTIAAIATGTAGTFDYHSFREKHLDMHFGSGFDDVARCGVGARRRIQLADNW